MCLYDFHSGEIHLQTEKSCIRADGIGYMNDVTNYPLICGEGARPRASRKKQDEDDIKNAISMVRLYNNIIIGKANVQHQLFADLRIYGLTAYKIKASLTMLDFHDWSDMPKFVSMYEAVIKWVLCVCLTKAGLIAYRKKRRMTCYSEVRFTKKLAQLRDLSKDPPISVISNPTVITNKSGGNDNGFGNENVGSDVGNNNDSRVGNNNDDTV
ncbi:hypothetical protein G9A89_012514 [Geosiphon pyriformis]|nr:hypothetical protein G9A89_012514 [Geosiphon pyriformis]